MKVSASSLEVKIPSKSNNQAKNKPVQTPSFSGKSKASMELARALVAKTSKFPRFLQWLGNNDGEILNAIVTGLGTAFVAPIFIAFNPFSKEDKDTKTYSAWRQPISAIITAGVQIGINMKYNAHLDKIASTGHFDRADLSMYPTKGYLAKIIKHQHPEYTKQQLETAVENMQIDARWKAIDEARGNKSRKGTMRDRKFKPEELVDDDIKATTKERIKKEFKAEIDKLSGKAKEKFIEDKVREHSGKVAIKVVEEKAKVKYKVREWIKKAQDSKTEFKELILAKKAELKRLRKSKAAESEIKFFEKTLSKLIGYGKYENVKFLGNSYKDVLQSVKIKQFIYAQADKNLSVLKSYKKWTGIVISLITLPFSCGLLNYAYPRIMEKIMPQVAQKKKQKEAAQMQPPKLNVVSTSKEGSK